MKNDELEQIKSAVSFSDLIEARNRENLKETLGFAANFGELFKEEKVKLPYHINLIDELHANENAHSRIFAKLLRYEENGKFPFLAKFLNDVCGFNLKVEKPDVKKVDSCGRIDIPIFDKRYVVVIENKVTDKAPDQNVEKGGQLARYIETIHYDYKRSLEEIFVIYTPKYTREPHSDCWVNKDNYSYKEDFKNRFISLSYRDCIYPWLKTELIPIIDENNVYLRSAVEQYIDYLEGFYSLRIINKEMNMKLQEFIKNELGLNDIGPIEATQLLSEKESELNNALNQVQLLKTKYKKQIIIDYFEGWEKSLSANFSQYEIVGDKFNRDKNCINVGLKFSFGSHDFSILIECNNCDKPNIYYGIGRHYAGQTKHDTITQILTEIMHNRKLTEPDGWWYGWRYTSLENAYMRLTDLLRDIETKIVQ